MASHADAEDEPRENLVEALGGPLGMAETSLPAAAFVVAYAASGQNTDISAGVALGTAVVFALARLVRRETPRHAITGLVGVAFAAFIATRSDRAEDFFLPGLLANAAYASAFLISLAVRRPLAGVIVGMFDGEGQGWRHEPDRVRAFTKATWLWAGLFLARLAVQLPLYLAGAVVVLGIARTAMGLPLFALGLWLSWRIVRPRQEPAADPAAT